MGQLLSQQWQARLVVLMISVVYYKTFEELKWQTLFMYFIGTLKSHTIVCV